MSGHTFMVSRKATGGVHTKVADVLGMIAMCILVLVLGILTALSAFTTSEMLQSENPNTPDVIDEAFVYHEGLPSWSFVIGLPVLAIVLVVLARVAVGVDRKLFRKAIIGVVAVAQIAWIAALNVSIYWYPDSRLMMEAAEHISRGEYEAFRPEYCPPPENMIFSHLCEGLPVIAKDNLFRYFTWYPFQSGGALWFAIWFAWFGSVNLLILQLVNAAAMTGFAVMLLKLGEAIHLDEWGQRLLGFLMVTCVPLLMMSAFIYTNEVGLFLATAALVCGCRAVRQESAWRLTLWTVAAFALCALAIMVKSTFNIFLIALFAVALVAAIRTRRYWLAALGAVLFAVGWKAAVLPQRILEAMTGVRFGNGLPMLSWLYLGLLDPNDGKLPPGWWTVDVVDMYARLDGDANAMSSEVNRLLVARLGEFAADPGMALDFFSRKLSSEWAEPTFQTMHYSSSADRAYAHRGSIVTWFLMEPTRSGWISYENVFQTMVYLTALIGVVAMMRHAGKRADGLLPGLFLGVPIVGGFLCYVLWEAKGIYALPFFLLMLPLAAYGLESMGQAAERVLSGHLAGERDLARAKHVNRGAVESHGSGAVPEPAESVEPAARQDAHEAEAKVLQ